MDDARVARAVRLGNTFTFAEVEHAVDLMEAVLSGSAARARQLAAGPLGAAVMRKFLSMRDSGQAILAGQRRTPRNRKLIDGDGAARKRANKAALRARKAVDHARALAEAAGITARVPELQEPFHAE
jgi:hypothetical protein